MAARDRAPRRPRGPPNPLFMKWIRELRDEARGTPARAVYERALSSLSRYPLVLPSGGSARILRGWGPQICCEMERRLRRHRREQGLPPTPPPPRRPQSPLAPPTPRPSRHFRPLPHSGAHALLMTLDQSSEPLPELELLSRARAQCSHPERLAAPGGALRSLLRRNLLQRRGHPPRYSLTPQGQLLAQGLAETPPEAPPPAPPIPFPEQDFELHPGTFDIILCADVTEANGKVPELLRGLLPFMLRPLPVGDFLWVAREKDPPTGHAPRELVLEVVVERKTAPDLGQSLRDGRYREQKFRLGRCGLRTPLYLLEEPRGGQQLPLPPPTLRQAAVSTQVVSGFWVLQTGGPRETAELLGVLGGHLERRFGNRVLKPWWGGVNERGPPEPPGTPCSLLPFQRLREGGGKNQAQGVGEVFARQLLQVGGLGGGTLRGVLSHFPTPASLLGAFGRCRNQREREEMLSSLGSLGPTLSRVLAKLYSTPGALS